jgi:hypothetical protein
VPNLTFLKKAKLGFNIWAIERKVAQFVLQFYYFED